MNTLFMLLALLYVVVCFLHYMLVASYDSENIQPKLRGERMVVYILFWPLFASVYLVVHIIRLFKGYIELIDRLDI